MGLNISIINNSFDALKYIQPKTDAEVVLYDLLKEAEDVKELIDVDVQDLKDEIDDLRAENKALYKFFRKVSDAYEAKTKSNTPLQYDDINLTEDIVNFIIERD
jgi:hypothetical protein